jgi:protein-tyrosine phosphatase
LAFDAGRHTLDDMAQTALARRHIPLDGAHNVRDLGGYPSRLGGTVRWDRLFRADRLDGLTPTDLDVIAGLELAVVYDLRTSEEREEAPDGLPSLHVPILSRVVANLADLDFASIVDHDHGVRFMTDVCIGMLRHAARELGGIVFTLADPARTPMMFHCTAGKDRTGVVAAVILEVLGVDRESVLDDFELTARYHRPEAGSAAFQRLLGRGIGPEAASGLMGAPRSMMADTLTVLDEEYGGVDRYLIEQGGVERDALESIRTSLLV